MDPQPPPQVSPEPTPSPASPETEVRVMETPSPKKHLLAVLAVVLLLVIGAAIIGGYSYHNSHHSKTEAAIDVEEHTYEAVVGIDGSGFSPGTLTIKPATEVFFENNTTNAEGEPGVAQRVLQSKAAADQETNFNSGSILAKSGYGHVFRKAGTYRFFEADNTAATLTVIVKN